MYSASAFIGPESAVGISVNKSDPSVVREKEGLPSNQRELTLVPRSCTELIAVGLGLSLAGGVISIHCRTLSDHVVFNLSLFLRPGRNQRTSGLH